MTIDYKGYVALKKDFFKKHEKADWNVDTSSMDQYGVYYKTYCFSDGAQWCERMAPVWRTAKAEVEVEIGIKVEIEKDVKLLEVEFWSTEMPSYKYYEKW